MNTDLSHMRVTVHFFQSGGKWNTVKTIDWPVCLNGVNGQHQLAFKLALNNALGVEHVSMTAVTLDENPVGVPLMLAPWARL